MPDTADTDIFQRFLADLQALPSRSRLDQADTEAIYALAYQQAVHGHFDTAYRYFSLLTLYRPTELKYLAGLALSYKMLQEYESAIGVYAYMAMIEADEPEHQLAIAECLLLQGNLDDARATLDLVARFCAENSGHEKTSARVQAITALLSSRDRDVA
ncbi:tetratricopeptide repeat protein [Comamonas antarctica]|uniref:tetratricopeptide repeat protein n=1 Tax=Comamonas antarctica TaxID=2743470 RepID=UPI0028F15748|nr:tetratricopeptide repeat protein [Comamonas antarctica]